jgi:hypothetical protein
LKKGQSKVGKLYPYQEEGKEKESCNDIRINSTEVIKQQFGIMENQIIPEGKLEGMFDYQIFNMKMEITLGQLIKIFP